MALVLYPWIDELTELKLLLLGDRYGPSRVNWPAKQHLLIKRESRENVSLLVKIGRTISVQLHTEGVVSHRLSSLEVTSPRLEHKTDQQRAGPIELVRKTPIMAAPVTSSSLLGAVILLFLLSAAGTVASVMAASAVTPPLDQLCGSLGSFYVTPELCASALCVDASACRSARGTPELAALVTRLVAANATAAKASLESALALAAEPAAAADAEAMKGMRSCLQLYTGAVPALRWAARSVAAGRYRGAREVLEAAQYVASGCAGMAGEVALPRENDRFSSMAIVAHAVVASMSTA